LNQSERAAIEDLGRYVSGLVILYLYCNPTRIMREIEHALPSLEEYDNESHVSRIQHILDTLHPPSMPPDQDSDVVERNRGSMPTECRPPVMTPVRDNGGPS
jgi:hypothetical protein